MSGTSTDPFSEHGTEFKPDGVGGRVYQPLRTANVRKETLELDLGHSNLAVDTPYISS